MRREMASLNGRAPSPLWVPVDGPKPRDWQERLLAYTCSEGAREQLVALERVCDFDEPRTRYLAAALTALRKVGLTLERWLDGLDRLDPDAGDVDALWRRSMADEQGARQRLTWELLVELVGFSGTDDPRFWAHHEALLRLQDQAAHLADTQTFFSCRPASEHLVLLDVATEVAELEEVLGPELSRCWYASRRTPAASDKVVQNGMRALSSQRSRFQHALRTAAPTERVALGVSYRRLYSRLSRRVHFSPGLPGNAEASDSARGHGDGEISISELRWGVIVVGRLGNLCLARLQALTGLPGGAVCRLQQEARETVPADPHADMLFAIAAGDVRVGDFALVHEHLVEVRAREVNALGYARYLVAYIAERPRPDVEEEWRPATDVHALWERTQVERWLEDALAQATDEERETLIATAPQQRLLTYLRAAWEEALRAHVIEELRNSPPTAYS
jgi:hypothetical protein